MPRPKKDCTPISFRIDSSIFEKLEEFCEKSGQSKTVAVERALMMYFQEYEKNMEILEKEKHN